MLVSLHTTRRSQQHYRANLFHLFLRHIEHLQGYLQYNASFRKLNARARHQKSSNLSSSSSVKRRDTQRFPNWISVLTWPLSCPPITSFSRINSPSSLLDECMRVSFRWSLVTSFAHCGACDWRNPDRSPEAIIWIPFPTFIRSSPKENMLTILRASLSLPALGIPGKDAESRNFSKLSL